MVEAKVVSIQELENDNPTLCISANRDFNKFLDTEFMLFLSKNKIPKKLLKTKPKNFVGMLFGIDIVSD